MGKVLPSETAARACVAEVYIGSGAGFQNQDYPVFSSDSDCKFLNFWIRIRIRILIL